MKELNTFRKYVTEGRMSRDAVVDKLAKQVGFDGKEVGFENIISMVMKDMDVKELGVEDGNEYLDKMIDRLEELKIK
jgi:hypothetical protein